MRMSQTNELHYCQNITDPVNGDTIHMTYAALEAKSNQLARKISQIVDSIDRKHANNDGDHVIAVCMVPSHRLIVTLLAVWKVGAAYLPLDVNTPVSRMEHIFKEVDPLILITEQESELNCVLLTHLIH